MGSPAETIHEDLEAKEEEKGHLAEFPKELITLNKQQQEQVTQKMGLTSTFKKGVVEGVDTTLIQSGDLMEGIDHLT